MKIYYLLFFLIIIPIVSASIDTNVDGIIGIDLNLDKDTGTNITNNYYNVTQNITNNYTLEVYEGSNISVSSNATGYTVSVDMTSLESFFNTIYVKLTDLVSLVGNWSADKINYFNKTQIVTNHYFKNETYNQSESLETFMTLNQSNWYNDTEGFIYFQNNTMMFNDSKLSTIYYNATSIVSIAGSIAGTINLTQHPDGNYNQITLNLTEVSGSPGLDIRINFTDGITRFNNGIMRYYTSSLAGDFPIIQLWDYDDNDWEDYPAIGETLTFRTIEQSVFDDTGHVSNGTVQMRIYKSSNGNTNNKYYIDWLAISKGYGTPAGEEVDPESIHKDGTIQLTNDWNAGLFNITAKWFKGLFNFTITSIDNYVLSSFDGSNINISLNETSLNNTISNEGVRLGFNSTYNSTYDSFAYNQTTSAVNIILGFGYYNETDFNITDYLLISNWNSTNESYYLKTNPYGFYNSTNFNITDYFTKVELLSFAYYNSTDFNISDYYYSVDNITTYAGNNFIKVSKNASGYIINGTDWNSTNLIIDWAVLLNGTGLIRNWNSTGYIKNWNSTGYIKNWNASGWIKNWNATNLIINWSKVISGGGGNPFDQSLNKSDNVTHYNMSITNNLKVGNQANLTWVYTNPTIRDLVNNQIIRANSSYPIFFFGNNTGTKCVDSSICYDVFGAGDNTLAKFSSGTGVSVTGTNSADKMKNGSYDTITGSYSMTTCEENCSFNIINGWSAGNDLQNDSHSNLRIGGSYVTASSYINTWALGPQLPAPVNYFPLEGIFNSNFNDYTRSWANFWLGDGWKLWFGSGKEIILGFVGGDDGLEINLSGDGTGHNMTIKSINDNSILKFEDGTTTYNTLDDDCVGQMYSDVLMGSTAGFIKSNMFINNNPLRIAPSVGTRVCMWEATELDVYAFGEIDLPFDYKEGTPLTPYIEWTSGQDPQCDVVFRIEYAINTHNNLWGLTSLQTQVLTTSGGNMFFEPVYEFTPIPGVNRKIDDRLVYSVSILGTDPRNTCTLAGVPIYLHSFGLKYEQDTTGSATSTRGVKW